MTGAFVIGLSLMAATVAAGFVWFGWGLLENVAALRARRLAAQAPAPAAEEDEDPKDEA